MRRAPESMLTGNRYGFRARCCTPSRNDTNRIDERVSALPGEGDLVENLAAKALGRAGDRAAAEVGVETDRGLVIRQRPDHEAAEPALGEVAAGCVEQLAAEAQPLEFRPQVELVDLAVVVEAAGAVAAVIGVARN